MVSPVSSNTALLQLLASIEAVTAARVDRTAAADYHAALRELEAARNSEARIRGLQDSALKSSLSRRRPLLGPAFSWLKAATTAFTFKTLC